MKSRVAFLATLIALVALALLFGFNCYSRVDEENENIRSQLEGFCQLTADLSLTETQDARKSMLETISLDPVIVKGLYEADGKAVYVSGANYVRLPEQDMAAAKTGKCVVYERPDQAGKMATYAVFQYEDGAFLLYSQRNATFWTEVLQNGMLMVFAMVLALSILLFLYLITDIRGREKRINGVMHALDQFSEGNFDARIEGFSDRDPEAAEYNAIIARIQDRIFKQRNRNHVLSVVMSQMQNGIIAVNQNMDVIYVNSMAKKLLGIVGNPENQNVNDVLRDVKLEDVFAEAMRQEGVYTNEVAARTTMGRGHRPLRLYVSPMRRDAQVVGALAIVEDITELRRLEQVRTDFAANVSHELKTPLTSIRGFVETLEAGAIDHPEMAHKFLRIIMMETERLTRLINDILSISKLESGSDEVTTERIRLDKKAFDICEMLEIHAGEKNVTLNYRLNDEPVYIIGNPDRVEQMLINLTENAIKYNRDGGSVTVQVFANDHEANVTISDTGIGIAEEHLPRLFERFYRVDKGRSRQMGGTGLGLAIVKHIVRSMNGEIEVHSKLGEGTEFLITLPLAPKENPDKDTIFDRETVE